MCFTREMNVFHTGDKHVENARSTFSHIHTASYQRIPNRTYVKMIASHSYSPANTDAMVRQRSKGM